VEAIAEAMQPELKPFGIQVQTINPGAYLTGFNEAMAENAFRWLDDEFNFTKRAAVQVMVAGLIGSPSGRMDPNDMIEKMIEVIPQVTGKFRNLHPKRIEEAVKAHQIEMFERCQLAACLRRLRNYSDHRRFEVTMRDRTPLGTPDPILSTLDRLSFDELWLFAVDEGSGLTPEDCEGISRFWSGGRGLLVARDHMDLGSSVCGLGAIGQAQHFHTKNLDPDETTHQIDDPYTKHILWPNFHSGSNGDHQQIRAVGDLHPVLIHPASPTGALQYLPAHPHEGSVGAPPHEEVRVIAAGTSKTTGRGSPLARRAITPASSG
jgi:hypothetical protein